MAQVGTSHREIGRQSSSIVDGHKESDRCADGATTLPSYESVSSAMSEERSSRNDSAFRACAPAVTDIGRRDFMREDNCNRSIPEAEPFSGVKKRDGRAGEPGQRRAGAMGMVEHRAARTASTQKLTPPPCQVSIAMFLAAWEDVAGHRSVCHRVPGDVEVTAITK